jgi:long-chain acyl-CoA synthetase
MNLFNLFEQNKNLCFIDFLTKEKFDKVSDIAYSKDISNGQKKLVFLYVDNSLTSIKLYLHFLSSPHAIVLLSNSINQHLKNTLEEKYKPSYIVDSNRSEIVNYSISENYLSNANLFIIKSDTNFQIAPELKLLLSTSGTTGSPKLVKLSEKNMLANALSIIDYLPINNTDVCPLNLPIHYSYGLSVLNTNTIAGGVIICSLPDVLDKNFWTALEEFKFTSIAGVPFVYEMLKRIGFTKKVYPSLKYITQAGGKLNEELVSHYAQYAESSNLSFYVMYGQTEATARMSFLPPKELKRKIGSIGKAIKNGEFSLEEETNQLIYKGANVFGGYAESIEDLNTYVETNLLFTGDIARVDEEGYYYIVGRLKRFIKLFGNRINLDEIEQILKNIFQNTTFVTLGSNDQFLYIVYNNPKIEKAEIVDFIKKEYAIHHSSIKVEYLAQIPLTSNGKVDYSKLKGEYGIN